MKSFDEIIYSVYNVASCVPTKLVQNNENKRFWKDIVSKLNIITLKQASAKTTFYQRGLCTMQYLDTRLYEKNVSK